MSKFPKCKNHHNKDCHALMKNGCCFCLSDTTFHKGQCPFYKNVEIVDAERKKDDPLHYNYMVSHGFYLKEVDRYGR